MVVAAVNVFCTFVAGEWAQNRKDLWSILSITTNQLLKNILKVQLLQKKNISVA